ncbi:LysR family transcriptional regulator [Acetobacter sacchari]|uniref:LysR family transcriptional regulator n=1 Tax=Acetobacter sacchari TaxID=2661687 RepID=A0ABS3LTC2_9PROT|nr:LysR family transcriptional regulator [Acetobacter sacchari]MBO1359159.1 LysR family transcriptional regulator [Acetobacter sacchari]
MANLTRTDLGDLNLVRVIARAGGFRRAALELDISPSALSHAVRNLEARLGVRLFNRTNRSVTPTDAGRALIASLVSGFGAIEDGLEGINRYRDRPIGRLRLNVLTDAARLILAPTLASFIVKYPDIKIDITVQDDFIDIVTEGYDAGIRFGGRVPEEMIAQSIGQDLRWIMVASPAYLENSPSISHPAELAVHRCIGLRTGTGALDRWELERDAEMTTVNVDWAVIVSETALAIELAERGVGITYCQERRVVRQIESGELCEVLPEWSSFGPAFHIYYPSRRQVPGALRALINHLRSSV